MLVAWLQFLEVTRRHSRRRRPLAPRVVDVALELLAHKSPTTGTTTTRSPRGGARMSLRVAVKDPHLTFNPEKRPAMTPEREPQPIRPSSRSQGAQRGKGHGAARPGARLEDGLDADLPSPATASPSRMTGATGDRMSCRQASPGRRISSRPRRLNAWTVRWSRTWSCARWPSSFPAGWLVGFLAGRGFVVRHCGMADAQGMGLRPTGGLGQRRGTPAAQLQWFIFVPMRGRRGNRTAIPIARHRGMQRTDSTLRRTPR